MTTLRYQAEDAITRVKIATNAMSDTDDAILAGYTSFIRKTAWEYSGNPEYVQDLVQEGYIAMWRALKSYDASRGVSLPTHLMNHARWRIAEVRQRGDFTGKPSQAGKKHSAGTRKNADREVSTDLLANHDSPEDGVLFDLAVYDDLDSVYVAYHHGEIYDAINTLPERKRQKVYERFWLGEYDPKNSAWWYAKRIGVRDLLRPQLEHLSELV
jgi:RNA polymerase sigma factor (sigma-70 family)